MVDQEDIRALAYPIGRARLRLHVGLAGIADRRQHRGCLQFGLGFFLCTIRIDQERRASAYLGNAILDADGAKGKAGVHVAVEMHHADRTAIPGAWALLVFLNKAHGPKLRRSRDRDSPGVAKEGVIGIHALAKSALNMIDRVNETRIHLDLATADHAHGTRLADAALVVAVDVRAHGELGLVLLGIQQLKDLLGILNRILTALDGAGDRAGLDAAAVDANEHLRRSANQIFVLAEIDEERVRRRVDLLQPAGNGGRLVLATLKKHLARDNLEQVATAEAFLRLLDQLGIFARMMVGSRRNLVGRDKRLFRDLAGNTFRRETLARELVTVAPGRDIIMINNENFVRDVEDDIALAGWTLKMKLYRVELEGQIITKGAVEPQIAVVL